MFLQDFESWCSFQIKVQPNHQDMQFSFIFAFVSCNWVINCAHGVVLSFFSIKKVFISRKPSWLDVPVFRSLYPVNSIWMLNQDKGSALCPILKATKGHVDWGVIQIKEFTIVLWQLFYITLRLNNKTRNPKLYPLWRILGFLHVVSG